jgi:hypothetical protein
MNVSSIRRLLRLLKVSLLFDICSPLASLTLLLCLIVSFPGALKAAHARIASLEAELEASRTAFDATTATKVNAEKSSKSALAKAKKAEKDLGIAKKEHL